MQYVGIENSESKRFLVKKAYQIGKIVHVELPCLTSNDCSRHFELLNIFDKLGNSIANKNSHVFLKTEYFRFCSGNGKKEHNIINKIIEFNNLYKSIKENGYKYENGHIILSTDGARLDGSHRASVVEHLNLKSIDVIMIDWNKYLDKKNLVKIKKHLKRQQNLFSVDVKIESINTC